MPDGTKRCTSCRKTYFTQGFSADRISMIMRNKQVCYNCAYWMHIMESPPENMEIVDGKCIKVFPMVEEVDESMMLGGNGRVRYFVRPDLSTIKTNDVWEIGVLPKKFKKKMPDTLIEVTEAAYEKTNKTKSRKICTSRGCFDRYSCVRYNRKIETDKIGAYNKIPTRWKAGGEGCSYFIDKDM